MASTQQTGSSAPPFNMESSTVPSGGAPLGGSLADTNVRSSPAPPSNASVQADNTKSKRTKRDSRKKREARALDQESQPTKKRTVTVQSTALPSSELSILRPLLLAEPRASDLLPPQPRQMNFVSTKKSEVTGQSWDFYEVVDKLTNKNGFRYSYAIADPGFPHIKYRQTDVSPYHARFSFEDSPAAILFTEDACAVTTNEPWHTARANVCAREGSYYYEARIVSGVMNDSKSASVGNTGMPARGHVRLGFARREADLDVNVGIDCYGYGIRDVNGEVVNRMRCEYFFPKGESIREGDVIGLLITLPPLALHKKIVEGTYEPNADGDASIALLDPLSVTNIIRDRIPFHYKSDFCWQQSNVFPTKQLRDYAFNLKETPTFGPPSPLNGEDASLRTLPGSSITVFKNGVKMGTPFKELYAFLPPASRLANGTNNLGIGERENADDGMVGYYPAVSCYGGGAVECRFDGPWWFGPPAHGENNEPVYGIGERFNEQIVEDIIADIVDEVEAMCVWGGVDGNVVGNAEIDGSGPGAVVGGSEVMRGGVEVAYESTIPPDSRVHDATLAHVTSHEPATLGDPDPGHTTSENVMSLDTAGTLDPDTQLSAALDTVAGDEDMEMS
ncbi:putative histone-lysine N-methyltransferase [Aspergillus indologenus CBS 114.80]|uniref:Putative histone-lysine N-methyltransferase n=1 Tax=Aspergillus indologenus CBS 114.80 TaxID=1450541 RepID=A0A2V5JAK9_9EURO|nr:putative histone-lysine N-methyltransferase [Aspergillus indologenus CBS 114.80]